MAARPGWYPIEGQTDVRWWDGGMWSQATGHPTERLASVRGFYLGGHPGHTLGYAGARPPVLIHMSRTMLEVESETKQRRKGPPVATFDLPLSSILGCRLDDLSPEHARGFGFMTGFYGSGQRVTGTSVLSVHCDGTIVLLGVAAPVAVAKAWLAPLLGMVPQV